jgi:hypothetical protein
MDGQFISSAARLTLSNAYLSHISMHAMGICLLGDGVHRSFDKYRLRFFWEANGPKHKYHWVLWVAICKPKDLGGLCIIDTKIMYICPILKWIWF